MWATIRMRDKKTWQMGLKISLLILLSYQAPRAHLDLFFSTIFFNFGFFLESCLLIPREWSLTTGAILLETLLCWKLCSAFHKLFIFPLHCLSGFFSFMQDMQRPFHLGAVPTCGSSHMHSLWH